MGLTDIGKDYGVSNKPIKRILLENNIKIRTAGETRREDLTSKVFGKLKVLRIDPEFIPTSGKHTKWLCQCECGNVVSIQSNHLKDGSQSACSPGCKHNIASGTRVGALTVIEATNQRSKNGGAIIYECLCDCGERILVSSTELRAKRKTSCSKCKETYGEAKIRILLKENNIRFEKEKIFHNFKNPETNKHYRFDFYVNDSYIIEYDGEQHFKPIDYFGGEEYLEICKIRDEKKNQYCKQNQIPIIRIPYSHLEDLTIEDLQLETSKFVLI